VAVQGTSVEVEVEGRALTLTNLAKPMYPTGFTKAQVIDYYRRVAPAMLPHLRGRPLTLRRFPHGAMDMSFFQKQAPEGRPAWVRTERVTHKGDAIEFVVCDDLPTLVWLANLAALELHPQLHRAGAVDTPTCVVFDLDPGPPAALLEACEVALRVRDVLGDLGLDAYPKVSGGKGLQVYLPLNPASPAEGADYEATKAFSHAIARLLEREQPERVVSKMTKTLRTGKVLVDWSQNDQVKTTVAVYALRAQPKPTASAPLAWAEVEAAVEARDAGPLVLEADAVLARVEARGDLFAPVAEQRQALPALA
jgi:bifunctional non-homologous end joining protein LigD